MVFDDEFRPGQCVAVGACYLDIQPDSSARNQAEPGGRLARSISCETKDVRDLLEPGDSFGGLSTLGFCSNGNTLRRRVTVFGQRGISSIC